MLTEEQLRACCEVIRLLAGETDINSESFKAREKLRDLVENHVKVANKCRWTPEIGLHEYESDWEYLKNVLTLYVN